MRLLFAAIFLLALPVLMIAHLQHYTVNLQGPLKAKAAAVLESPEFARVEMSLFYMDVTLKGRVDDLAARERARKLIDDLDGLRCREQDNLLQISAKLNGRLAGSKLLLSGWLHDENKLRDAVQWLATARPGIEVVTDEVHLNPHVTLEDPPAAGSVPAAYRGAWSAIEVPASLQVRRADGRVTVSGNLRSAATKEAVIAAVTPDAGPGNVDAKRLEAGLYVGEANFSGEMLPVFLKAFFSTPGASEFTADARIVHVSADATPTMQSEWVEMLGSVARGAELQTDIQVFPSVFHFPGRVVESQIPPEALGPLQDVLHASIINFSPGYATPEEAEQPKIVAAANAILTAGPDVRIIVGGHVDTSGDPKDNTTMARRRAEGVVAELVARRVPSELLQVEVFEAVPEHDDLSRQVELLIK
jgi:outer membrane protein OmpA-like peptidoglycan-associated protein